MKCIQDWPTIWWPKHWFLSEFLCLGCQRWANSEFKKKSLFFCLILFLNEHNKTQILCTNSNKLMHTFTHKTKTYNVH